ncbi:hypothetical protein [Rhizobium leguminosarum]|uniref:hypothetical protein n=1 Tax=Rhizobium leguminosarum TaxID=384 RepID=UPI002E1066F3|nr:hypothetical protein U8Q02_42940 [Rhizobium leguminosarum]
MGDGNGKRQYPVYVTAAGRFHKVVLISGGDVDDQAGALKKALSAHPFPVRACFGDEREPMEIDIANVLEEPAQAVELEGGGWQVRLVASLWACGTFLHEYADADEAINDGVLLFPGWPDEIGDGWAFSQTEYAEVEGVEPTGRERAAETDAAEGPSSLSLLGAA